MEGPEKRCGILSRGPNQEGLFSRALYSGLRVYTSDPHDNHPTQQFATQQRRRGNREIRSRRASLLGCRRRIQAAAQAQSRACALRAGALHARTARACSMWAAAADCSPKRWRAPARTVTGHRPRAEHDRNRAAARARFRARHRLPRRSRPKRCCNAAPENSTSSPAWKCSSTFPIRPRPSAVLGKLVRPGGHVFISTINRNFKSFALAIVGAEYVAQPGAARHA